MVNAPREEARMSFREQLQQSIRSGGPITVAEFMDNAVGYYYATHEPFGLSGDFITAPEISQIFGEMLGLWCAMEWEGMGRPAEIQLIELGPGRGTLMVDILRATKHLPGFHQALSLHLVERSEKLRGMQQAVLASLHPRLSWHTDFSDIPPAPFLLVANEFFDALPVHQFVKRGEGFRERLVGLDQNGELNFVESEASLVFPISEINEGEIIETSEAGDTLMRDIASRITSQNGSALIIDYGYTEGHGDTLQAVSKHHYTSVLEGAGETDLTAHVDFGTLKRSAESQGASAVVTTQAEFMERMGGAMRLENLRSHATEPQGNALVSGYDRLISADQMGTLFKVMMLSRA
jgi:NADH dehydrogenase [ubiquinone] 1 alpha subcomplex assembly factor 7